ncbi:unnamed protein product [Prorocentrum cordatum]|uniref:GST N-terminal domain-containing protein n=1 Tax=Prorocentrum cordatum TaxID=2364126 RepID=A0ABN9VXN7_9DINO|nr:unnamed protein product [Polarella glacialis]
MTYRVFGSAGSPYSVKVRSYFRYKDIDHVWVVRNSPEAMSEHAKYSKLPLVPTVVSPDGKAMQDSTPIIEAMEALFPEPAVHPADGALRFVSELLEEFGDEWGNKWMMHLRWYSASSGPTTDAYARRIAAELRSGAPPDTPGLADEVAALAASFKDRMLGRGFTVGSSEHTAPISKRSYLDAIVLLEAHFATGRPYILGRSPSMADFGLAGQLYQCFQDLLPGKDLLPGEQMRLHAPSVALWCERMVNPRPVSGGGFEAWPTLAGTLEPFLASQVAMFLMWSDANSKARGEKDNLQTGSCFNTCISRAGRSSAWISWIGGGRQGLRWRRWPPGARTCPWTWAAGGSGGRRSGGRRGTTPSRCRSSAGSTPAPPRPQGCRTSWGGAAAWSSCRLGRARRGCSGASRSGHL